MKVKHILYTTLIATLSGCANFVEFEQPSTITTVKLLTTVSYADGKTFVKGTRYRLYRLKTGQLGVLFDSSMQMGLVIPTVLTWGVEVDQSGCTTGKRFYPHDQTKGSINEPSADKGLKLWTPNHFCFDMNSAESS